MNYTIESANSFIAENKGKVEQKYRLKYHMMPPCGWMNDPNGLIKINDTYHLFYQFYPYDSKWGPMHWGHFETKDLISYEDKSVAIAPTDQSVESGCFSGGAFLDSRELNLIYTRHFEKENFKSEKIYLAKSTNYETFDKCESIVFDNESLPKNLSRSDFRDPYLKNINGVNYIFIGGKDVVLNQGVIIVLKSDTLDNFKYDFTIGPFYELGDMGECPSLVTIDGKDVIVLSGCNVKEKDNNYKNVNSSVFVIGKIDYDAKKMDIFNIKEIDKGDTFYAPQFINNEDGIMIGWLEMWGKPYPTDLWHHNWVGAYSIPRKITIVDNDIYQMPIDSIKKYYKNTYKYNNQKVSKTSDLLIKFASKFRIEFKSSNGTFVLSNDEYISLDTSNSNNMNPCIRHTNNKYANGEIRVLLDNSSVEIFVNNGIEAISSRIYLDSDYELEVTGQVDILVNEIEV